MLRLYMRDLRAEHLGGREVTRGTVQYLVDSDLGAALMLTVAGQQQRGDL